MKLFYVVVLIFFGLIPFHSLAMIDYISLHEIELNTPQALSIKLNIVEKDQNTQLKFVLKQHKNNAELSYKRLNNYMLRLKGNQAIKGKAAIVVYQSIDNTWKEIKQINLKTPPITRNIRLPHSPPSIKPKKQIKTITNNTAQLASGSSCILDLQPKETLWGVAKRYSNQWNIDIYSAIIAIYTQNKNQFSQQHINLLRAGALLTCPDKKIMDTLGSTKLMKQEFNRLHNKAM